MDERQFDALYQDQWSPLVRQVTALCGDPAEAADCVQEAFVRAWEHRSQLTADAGGWVRTAALRVAVSRWRKTRNALTAWTREHDRRGPDRVALQPGHEHDAPVWRALAGLPAAQREALVLHHVVDLGVAQVAEVLGVPTGTVKARLSRGRTAMAAALGADGLVPVGPGALSPDAPRGPAAHPDGRPAAPTRTEGVR